MKETLNLIAHATHNEFDTLILGKAGDQIGCELQARAWFSYPWDYIYRAKNIEDREKIANLVEKAVLNGFIGYDTNRNNRDTLFKNIYKNFSEMIPNSASLSANIMRGLFEFFVNISNLGCNFALSQCK